MFILMLIIASVRILLFEIHNISYGYYYSKPTSLPMDIINQNAHTCLRILLSKTHVHAYGFACSEPTTMPMDSIIRKPLQCF